LVGRVDVWCKITTGSARRGAPKLLLGATTFVRGPGGKSRERDLGLEIMLSTSHDFSDSQVT
jgi:hypothetical protein